MLKNIENANSKWKITGLPKPRLHSNFSHYNFQSWFYELSFHFTALSFNNILFLNKLYCFGITTTQIGLFCRGSCVFLEIYRKIPIFFKVVMILGLKTNSTNQKQRTYKQHDKLLFQKSWWPQLAFYSSSASFRVSAAPESWSKYTSSIFVNYHWQSPR